MSDCDLYGHALALTYGWRRRGWRLRLVHWLRCWDCDLSVGPDR